jgi:thioredoxin-dependent peroxiredoxin
LELHKEEIEAAGLQIVAIGLGEPKHARRFGDKLAPSVTCLTNEKPDLYDTYGIGRGNLLRLVAPDALKAGARASSKGFTQGSSTGDTLRLGAVFIVDEQGIVQFAYYGKHAGDHPDIPSLIEWWREETAKKIALKSER